MKVFLSHQQKDAAIAATVAARLHAHRVDYYLDTIDSNLNLPGELLGDYLRREMGKCTQLIAVVSQNTKDSSWVPWEIGVATEKDFPLATYLAADTAAPEFLRKWPYLRSGGDIDMYVQVSREAESNFVRKRGLLAEDSARQQATSQFFRSLRSGLRQ